MLIRPYEISRICFMHIWQSFYTEQNGRMACFDTSKTDTRKKLIRAITDILKVLKVDYFILLSMFVSLESWTKLFCRSFVRYCFIYISVFKYQYFSTMLCYISPHDCRCWTICCVLLHFNSFSFCGSLKHTVVCRSLFFPHHILRVNWYILTEWHWKYLWL